MLEAANRCARALGSSLDIDEAFGAFIRELRGLVPFDRTAIVLAEEASRAVMATAGAGVDEVFPPGTPPPIAGIARWSRCSRRDDRTARTCARRAIREEGELVGSACAAAGRAAARGRAGDRDDLGRPRRSADAFTQEEVELLALLGRFVATAVAEHPRLRGGAHDRRGAAPPVGAARGLRLARLARAAQPDGGGDRLRADAAAALARADA